MKVYRIFCSYLIEAKNIKDAECQVAEEAGIDFTEKHIMVEKYDIKGGEIVC